MTRLKRRFKMCALMFAVLMLFPAYASLAQDNTVTVPAGTVIMVETQSAVNSGQHGAGYRFQSVLVGDLVAPDGTVVAPNGSTVFGILNSAQKSGRIAGKAELVIAFDSIMVNNRRVPITTSQVQAVTQSTAGKSTGQVARGAAIGGLIDGRSGARTGAKVGAGAAILSGGNQVNVPSGTLLEVQLRDSADFPTVE